ncbi:HEAT repeat domain-containing protein [Chitinophaga sp. sic0106]|uniref:HEAT repeat domain-containing protein n=1 Tax=Chitinophaga sp. sic0106 TaxID=2854785 RepID=UPI001C487CB3|nr:hypothetical protein [Chitinophaga sp. sic0106]MBV7533074.1 hypothetical protein [Chitinophaga sp. sic0106]
MNRGTITRICFIAVGIATGSVAHAQHIQEPSVKSKTSFAIVVDEDTYRKAKPEIDAYRTAVEQSGLGTYVIYDNWKNPEQIRKLLKDLYARPQKLEGTVLVGNIPVAMIRDAQYLTSTFKMNQKINWQRSSVPSDRYYDDFHMDFDFIKQDSLKKNYFYYSINPDAAQQLNKSIYSARIKPPVMAGKESAELISEYLKKVVAEKKKKNPVNDMFISTAHGYNSESINSVAGEQMALRNQFPAVFSPGNVVKFYHFTNEPFLKFSLLSALKQPETDIAIMHGHGDSDIQLINGYPYVSNPQGSKENILRYLRAKIQSAKEDGRDVEATKASFVKSLGVPMSWMDNALDPEVIKEDSIYNHNLDIHIDDIIATKPNARFVSMDNCLTGSFHLDEYIAGYYPFSGGSNIVAVANSVGVLQDLWPDEGMGLLQHGVRVGNWFKNYGYLETHIMGDPTFSFSSISNKDINDAVTVDHPLAYWKSLLQTPDADIQGLSLIYLKNKMDKAAYSALLKDTYFNSQYETTRMQAFQQLEKLNDKNYVEVLKAATTDPYEFIRRRALYEIGENGGDEFAATVVNMIVNDYQSERIGFKIRGIIAFMNAQPLLKEIDKQITPNSMVHFEQSRADLVKSINYNEKKVKELTDTILDKSKTDKSRISEITTMRAYRYHQTIPALVTIVKDAQNSEAVKMAAMEALSWFPRSYRVNEIIALCKEVSSSNNYSAALKTQARKNLNIIQ